LDHYPVDDVTQMVG